jgi:alkylhydroperoxidase family enzyme
MQLTIHTLDSAPHDSRARLGGIQADLGVLPNLAAASAESPTLLRAFDAMRRAVAAGTLDPIHRELAGLTVGVAVDNRYGVAFHSTMLASLGVSDAEIDAVRAGGSPKDDTLAAVFVLARSVVLDRGKVDDGIITVALAAGLSASDILEVVTECAFAGLVGTIDNLAGHVEPDDFLAPRRWTPSQSLAGLRGPFVQPIVLAPSIASRMMSA